MESALRQITYRSDRTIRMTTDAQGETWWVAKDVCDVLDLDDTRRAVERLDEDEWSSIPVIDALGRQQQTLAVNESGLYSLILGSRKLEAKAFKRWITHEVLPSIRRTGRYEASGSTQAIPPRSSERAEVSEYLIRVWQTLKSAEEWLSNREIARRSEVSGRTSRAYTKHLLDLGLIDRLRTFPGHRFRISEQAEQRNSAVYQRLNLVEEALATRTLPAILGLHKG